MRRLLFFLLSCLLMGASTAAHLAPAVRAEIEGLLGRLEASRCEFQRNGVWHSAADASSHLRGKLNYLDERGMVASAEQFIERAATQSSMTGGAYRVRCANATPVPSSTWLSAQLQRMRVARGGKNVP